MEERGAGMYCTSCGRQVADAARFCPYCGAQTAPAAGPAPVSPDSGPGPEPGPDPGPEPGPDAPAPKRGTVLRVLGIVAVVLVVLCVGCTLLGGLGGDTSEDEEDVAEVADDADDAEEDADDGAIVYYYGDGSTVAVPSTAHIVFRNDAGEDIEDYEVTLLSEAEDGTLALTQLEVSGEEFVPAEHDVEPGTYSVAVRDPSTNKVYTVPSVTVVDDEADADEVNVIFEPDPDGGSEDEDSAEDAARKSLYALYLSKIYEYEGLYGSAATLTYTDGSTELTYISGVALYLLVDFDGDDTEELLLVYEPSEEEATFRAEVGGYAVEVWAWDEAASDIALVSSTYLTEAQDYGTYLTVYEASEGAAAWFDGFYYDPEQEDVGLIYEVTYLWGEGDGSHALVSASEYDDLDPVDLGSTLDGADATSDEVSDAYGAFSEALAATTGSVTYDLCGVESWDWCDDLDSTDAARDETLQTLLRGLFGLDDDEDDAAGSAYAAYLGLLEEYEATYGAGAETRVSEDYPSYLTGLCFATLLDMDKDGTEELVLAYYSGTDDVENFGVFYTVEAWAWEDGELVCFSSGEGLGFDGASRYAGIASVDGTGYVVNGGGDDNGEYVFTTYVDGEAVSVSVTWEYVASGGGETIYAVDGTEVSFEEYYEWSGSIVEYFLNYSEYSTSETDALASLEETLATLEAAS